MQIHSKPIELIKTFLIFFLLATLGLNFYLFFIRTNKDPVLPQERAAQIEKAEVLQPYKIRYSRGNQNYYMFNELDEKLCDTLTEYLLARLSRPYRAEKIEGIPSKGDSLHLLVFSYYSKLPLRLFESGSFHGETESFSSIKEVYFLIEDAPELIVYTGSDYFAIKAEEGESAEDKVSAQNIKERIKEVLSSNSARYRQASYILSGDEEREHETELLFPYRGYQPAGLYELKPEADFSVSGTYGTWVNKIFEAKTPFVKEAENTEGDRIYLSEHGNDILRISKDGYLDYRVEYSKARRMTDLHEDFANALSFHTKFDREAENLRLDKVNEVDKNGYFERTFTFSRNDKVGRYRSGFCQNGITVRLDGGEIVEYKRYLPSLVKEREDAENGVTYSQNSVLELITKKENFQGLKEMYWKEAASDGERQARRGEEELSEKEWSGRILNAIDEFELSYYEAERGEIRPCYLIKIGNSSMMIDLFTKEEVKDELG